MNHVMNDALNVSIHSYEPNNVLLDNLRLVFPSSITWSKSHFPKVINDPHINDDPFLKQPVVDSGGSC